MLSMAKKSMANLRPGSTLQLSMVRSWKCSTNVHVHVSSLTKGIKIVLEADLVQVAFKK
jgi:hypothetical protein